MPYFKFRPLTRSDFPLLCRWLAQPHVQRWWADDASLQGVERDYGANVDGTEPSEVFIAWQGGRPFGLAQRFCIAAYPPYWQSLARLIEVPSTAWSIDYFVGEPSDLGCGRGTFMLQAFTRKLWRDQPSAAALIVPVHVENIASWRALEKIGFVRAAKGLLAPDNPADTPEHYIYRLERASS
jgi:aminoglycoside 6'-N-acetyltransferase